LKTATESGEKRNIAMIRIGHYKAGAKKNKLDEEHGCGWEHIRRAERGGRWERADYFLSFF